MGNNELNGKFTLKKCFHAMRGIRFALYSCDYQEIELCDLIWTK